MSRERPATDAPTPGVLPDERSTLVNALLGAVVAVVLSFVPFSPALGGAVAGYLQGRDGPRVGGLSGLLAAVPIALFGVLAVVFLSFFVAVGPGASPLRGLVVLSLFLFVGVLMLATFSVVLGAAGGVLGVALAERYADGRRRSRRTADESTTPGGESTVSDESSTAASGEFRSVDDESRAATDDGTRETREE